SPAAGIIWDVNDRVAEWGKIPNHEWIRYYANTWPEIVEDSWLREHPQAWDHCQQPWTSSPRTNIWVLAVDMALKQDSVAVNRCEWLGGEDKDDIRVAVTSKIWNAKDCGGPSPHRDVLASIRPLAPANASEGGRGRGGDYDPRFSPAPP